MLRLLIFLIAIVPLFGFPQTQEVEDLLDRAEQLVEDNKIEEAIAIYKKGMERFKNHDEDIYNNYGLIVYELGSLYDDMGDYEKALPYYIEELEITENTIGKEHTDYASSLNNLGQVYVAMGHYDKALPLMLEALEIDEKILGREHPDYATSLNNLAMLYNKIGAHEKALTVMMKALEITEMAVGNEHISYGTRLSNLGQIYIGMGHYDKALPLMLEELEIVENTIGKEHPDYAISLNNLALFYIDLEKYEKALPLLKAYNTNIISRLQRNFAYQTAKEKQAYVTNVIGGRGFNFFSNFNYLTNNSYDDAVIIALNNILTSKGLVLNATKDLLADLKSLNNKALNDSIRDFIGKRTFITKQLQLPIGKRDSTLMKVQESSSKLERVLVNAHKKHFKTQIDYVKDFKNTKLKNNDLAIEFTHFNLYQKKWTDSIMYVAYLYKKDWDSPKAINLFEEKELKDYFERYSSRGSIAFSKKSNEKVAISELLYELIWQPLEPYLENVETIYYSPDGLLHKVPINALPTSQGRFLGEVYNLNRVSNTATINTIKEFPDLSDAILLGDIIYDYTQNTKTIQNKSADNSILKSKELLGNEKNKKRNTTTGSWGYLPGTKDEIEFIQSQLPKSKVLRKTNATETAFKKLSGNSPSILHVSTHGFFFPDAEEEKTTLETQKSELIYVLSKDPLLRSGLILANANYAWENGSNPYEIDDGILTALEISSLDLRKTDIVILSACETGLGDIPSSEGVYGLQRAFKMAGVNTIVMTLWEVPDKETAEFMKKFYTKWNTTKNSKEAFKFAQSFMMKKYRYQPDKWAAFVLFE